ncbi:MAG: DeoR/GlpR family DNA-binding transcription regulator [Succinivibrio sp.]|nr:DeoR/GlpR family DNA-binding transcription regulator [Succinivibrio sp.]
MLAIERKQRIVALLKEHKRVYVSLLSEELNVAEETIRRDLKEIEKKGIAIKCYGGAILKSGSENFSFLERVTQNFEAKREIARCVMTMIHDGMTLMVDTSTTAKAVIDSIKNLKDITVITNSYKLISDNADSQIRFIGTGGEAIQKYQAFVGSDAGATIRRYNADLAILGCSGVTMEKGFMETNIYEATLKSIMVEYAKETVIVADHNKFERISKINNFRFSDIDYFATDLRPTEAWCSFLEHENISLLYPGCEPLDKA